MCYGNRSKLLIWRWLGGGVLPHYIKSLKIQTQTDQSVFVPRLSGELCYGLLVYWPALTALSQVFSLTTQTNQDNSRLSNALEAVYTLYAPDQAFSSILKCIILPNNVYTFSPPILRFTLAISLPHTLPPSASRLSL